MIPPNNRDSAQFLSGAVPNVLLVLALGPHSQSRSSSTHTTTRGVGNMPSASRPPLSVAGGAGEPKRSASIFSVLSAAVGLSSSEDDEVVVEERTPLLGGENEDEERVEGDEEVEEDDAIGATSSAIASAFTTGGSRRERKRRNSRSRSKSQRRKLHWWERPSPIWFLPGTLLMSLSIGMIISPKMEIFTQLVCRTIPPPHPSTPATSAFSIFLSSSPVNARPLYLGGNSSTPLSLNGTTEGEHGPPEEEEGTDWSRNCRSRPEVQKGVATLATGLLLASGLLSALTTGFWGALSDRRGRKPVLALALFGTLVMDAVFLVVVNYHDTVGYKFLLLGPAFDGLVGGMATAQAATNAYLSDCTDPGSRARIFSILGGLLFGGIALGPTLGSLLIKISPSPSAVLRPFYVALALHMIYLLAILFFVPESLSIARQLKARERWDEEESSRGGWRPWNFLRPLALLGKKKVEAEGEEGPVLWSKKAEGGRDVGVKEEEQRSWALTKIAVGYAGYVFVIAIAAFKIQYAQFKFRWSAIENGFYLSFIGLSRMLVLVVLLPLFIRYWRTPPPEPQWAKPLVVNVESEGGERVAPLPEGMTEAEEEEHEQRLDLAEKWEREAKYLRVVHDSHFDLLLARFSVLLDLIGYTLMALPIMGTPTSFLVLTAVQSFGGGASPALQSLALAHASPRDSGRLFASLSVLQALCAQVIGPLIFGSVFFKSVGWFPEAIFGVGALFFAGSLGSLMLVRLGGAERAKSRVAKGSVVGERDTLARGRSETRKPVTGSEIYLRD